MGIQFTDINGQHCSYASTEIKVGGLYLPGVKMISYKYIHEIGHLRGTGSHRLGRTRGTEEAEGSIELFKRWEKQLLALITSGGTIGFAELGWPTTCSYFEPASPQDAMLDVLMGVRFHSPEDNHSEGPDGLTVTYQMDIMRLIKNGMVGLRPR